MCDSWSPGGCVVGDLDSVSCFVFVVLAGVGVSLFLGLFWLVRRVFSGFWGSLCFSLFCSLVGVGAAGGGFRGSGFGAPGRLASFRGRVGLLLFVGGGSGVSARARFLSCPVLAVVGVGGRGGVRVLPGSCGGGRGCARFLLLLVVVGFFRALLFPSGASCLLVLRCLVLCWVVVSPAGSGGLWGGRVGFGVVFSPASVVLARACFRLFVGGWFGFGLGFVWRV